MQRKWINLVLILALVMTAFIGCSKKTEEANSSTPAPSPSSQQPSEQPKDSEEASPYGDTGGLKLPLVDEPTTLTWVLASENQVTPDKLVVQEIEKRTGIKVEFQTYPTSTFVDKVKVIVGSGKLPDIFNGLTASELKKIGQQNGVVAINDYADMLPNFKKLYLEENPWVVGSYGDSNGKLYTWPIYNLNRDVNHGFMYRKDIFDKHEIKEWTNTEEFYEALKKLKEIYPDSYPYASKNMEYIYRDWAYGWGLAGTDGNYPVYYDQKDKTWKYASIQPEHKDMLDFMKKLYNEGLIDPEFLTDTPDSWTTKMTTDKSFITYDWIGRLDLFYNQVSSVNPDYDLRYAYPVGPTGKHKSLPRVSDFGLAVANNKNKEAALKLLDYLTSPSGSELITIGVEGVNFEWGPDGKPVYPELKDLPLIDISVLADRYGMWLETTYLNPDRRSVYYNYSEKEQEAQDKIVKSDRFHPIDPVLNFTDEEISVVSELQTSLRKASEEFNANYILNKSYDDKKWEEWQNNAKKLGVDKLVEMFNEAQKRLDAAN